jgi:hypothetical protein
MINITFNTVNTENTILKTFTRTFPDVPKPLDIVIYLDRRFKVLNNPYIWNMESRFFEVHDEVTIELELLPKK